MAVNDMLYSIYMPQLSQLLVLQLEQGLPPLLIHVGSAEVLMDDARRFASRAREAGVEVSLKEWEDMIHVFQAFAMLLPEGQQAVNEIGTFIREHLRP